MGCIQCEKKISLNCIAGNTTNERIEINKNAVPKKVFSLEKINMEKYLKPIDNNNIAKYSQFLQNKNKNPKIISYIKYSRININYGNSPKSININEKSIYQINKIKLISTKLWTQILDYVNYKELKEIGKINKFYNSLVRNPNLLVKFYKKKPNNISIYRLKNNIINNSKLSNNNNNNSFNNTNAYNNSKNINLNDFINYTFDNYNDDYDNASFSNNSLVIIAQ